MATFGWLNSFWYWRLLIAPYKQAKGAIRCIVIIGYRWLQLVTERQEERKNNNDYGKGIIV